MPLRVGHDLMPQLDRYRSPLKPAVRLTNIDPILAMVLITCPDCGLSVSDAAPACIRCGRPHSPRPLQPADQMAYDGANDFRSAAPNQSLDEEELADVHAGQMPFYALDISKFVILSLCTFGLYDLFWFYRNWRHVQTQLNRSLSPFWRAFFAPLWSFSLFREVREYATVNQQQVGWSAGFLGAIYLFWVPTWRLPDPWWLITLLSFIPLVPVQQTINEVATELGVAPDRKYSAKHVAVILLGGLFTILAVIGTLMPVE